MTSQHDKPPYKDGRTDYPRRESDSSVLSRSSMKATDLMVESREMPVFQEGQSVSQELPHPLFYEDEAYDFQRETGVLSLVDSLPPSNLIEQLLPSFEQLDLEREADTLLELAAVGEDLTQEFDRESCFDSASDLPLGLLDGLVPAMNLQTMTSLQEDMLFGQMEELLFEDLYAPDSTPMAPAAPTPTLQLTPPNITQPPSIRLPSMYLLVGMTRRSSR